MLEPVLLETGKFGFFNEENPILLVEGDGGD